MYQNLIRRTSAANSPKPLFVSLPKMPFNEKAAFVESVCANLTDSRFGPGRRVPIAMRLSQWPELEPAVFYDVTVAGPVPSYSIVPDSEMARRYMADAIRCELQPYGSPCVSIHIQKQTPQTLGRGSPFDVKK